MKYHLEISASAEKVLYKSPVQIQDKFFSKISSLENNPRPFGCKKLHGSGYYRIRIGDYRIIYSISDSGKTIKILDIGHRKDIYR